MHVGVFEYAKFKNGRNQIVALGFPAENSKFKMAALKTGCTYNLEINAPISVILVSITMFTRSMATIKKYFKHIISIIIYKTLKTLSKWLLANKVLLSPGMCFNDSRYTSNKSKAIH